jgi:hypothetical protein
LWAINVHKVSLLYFVCKPVPVLRDGYKFTFFPSPGDHFSTRIVLPVLNVEYESWQRKGGEDRVGENTVANSLKLEPHVRHRVGIAAMSQTFRRDSKTNDKRTHDRISRRLMGLNQRNKTTPAQKKQVETDARTPLVNVSTSQRLRLKLQRRSHVAARRGCDPAVVPQKDRGRLCMRSE